MHESCGRWLSGTRNVFTVLRSVIWDRHRPIAHAGRAPHSSAARPESRSA